MEPRKNEDMFEIAMLTYRVEHDGLLVTTAKDVERDEVNGREFLDLLKSLSEKNGGKICVVSDVTKTKPLSKEMREFFNEGMAPYVTALAMHSESVSGNAMAFIYETLQGSSLTVKVCANEQEGREWLKPYLSQPRS